MNGLLRRLTRRRAAPADETPPGTTAASEPADATVISVEEERPLSEEEQALLAREEELRRRRRDLPAGIDPAELETAAGEGASRGALRRRVRYLRRIRELLLRDLGGFYYEVHRSAGGTHGGHRDILENKAERLDAVDRELRELEGRLGEPYSGQTVLREPGIGGTCPTCGELHASDAGWCAHCGTPLSDRARRQAEQEVDRAIAARREAEAAAAAPQAPAHDPATGELAARVREVTARDEGAGTGATAAAEPDGDERAHDLGSPANGTVPEGDAPTRELRTGGDDPVTHGERRR
jgi:hypothetical protein